MLFQAVFWNWGDLKTTPLPILTVLLRLFTLSRSWSAFGWPLSCKVGGIFPVRDGKILAAEPLLRRVICCEKYRVQESYWFWNSPYRGLRSSIAVRTQKFCHRVRTIPPADSDCLQHCASTKSVHIGYPGRVSTDWIHDCAPVHRAHRGQIWL